MTRGTIVVAGSLAQKPQRGGHTWVLLNWVLGLRRLGWDVVFLDRLAPEMCRDAADQPCRFEASRNLTYFLEVMQRFGLEGQFSLDYDLGARVIGVPRREVIARAKQSAFLLNIMGFLDDEELLAAAPQRIFLDIDPGFGQMWRELGLHDAFRGYDQLVTIGLNIGQPGCTIPTCGLPWTVTPQPIVLEHWPVRPGGDGGPWTSVASWRGAYGPVEFAGEVFGQRVHEFRKFVSLPTRSGQPFEVALDIHAGETNDLALLQQHGWKLADPLAAAGSPDSYQAYIAQSRAEFMVAKSMYVKTASGWFSDRSICYLASGRPVLAQDTGLTGHLPAGHGLVTFRTLDDAIAGVEEITARYGHHTRAAREVAEAYFDSDLVLERLLTKLGVA